jgi:truncated hemoglobin YjbI
MPSSPDAKTRGQSYHYWQVARIRNSSLYEALGGKAGSRRLAVAFYARVERDPLLRPLFPGKSFTCAIEEFAAFLAQFLGGPTEDSQRRWWLSLRESHLRFQIGDRERKAWLANMAGAFDDVHVAEPLRSELLRFFERSSAHVVNQGGAAAIDREKSKPYDHSTHAEISGRWEAQIRLDEAVAAIRAGNAAGAIRLIETSALESYGRSVHCGLLSLMVRCAADGLLDYLRARLAGDPALTQERYAGRTLLHDAAAAGNLAVVELLLSFGADPNSQDGGGHTPLYSVGNECAVEGGGMVVFALVRAGGAVDAHAGVKHCTALHMAARRGNEEVAQALLDCGANIEARDSVGETPLRRAVNCDKTRLASLLLAKGADVRCTGSKGITPLLAARSTGMKVLLQRYASGEIDPA